MNLYQINSEITALIDSSVNPETGEISSDVSTRLDQLLEQKDQKIINSAKYIKNRAAFVDAMKSEIKSLQERVKSEERKIEYLEGYAKAFMTHGEKYEDAQCCVSLRKSQRVDVLDINLVPQEYKKEKIEITADKKLIADALKAGAQIEGAKLTEGYSLQIK